MTDRENDLDNDLDNDLGTQGDKDSLKGKMNQAGGRVQRAFGSLTGDQSQEAKGAGKELKGNVQEGMGKTERKADDLLDDE
jgi:uncharacterized protein YjbJ (UPF0337 family)